MSFWVHGCTCMMSLLETHKCCLKMWACHCLFCRFFPFSICPWVSFGWPWVSSMCLWVLSPSVSLAVGRGGKTSGWMTVAADVASSSSTMVLSVRVMLTVRVVLSVRVMLTVRVVLSVRVADVGWLACAVKCLSRSWGFFLSTLMKDLSFVADDSTIASCTVARCHQLNTLSWKMLPSVTVGSADSPSTRYHLWQWVQGTRHQHATICDSGVSGLTVRACSHLVSCPCPVFFALLVRGSVLALPVSAGLGEQGDVARKVEHSQSALPPGLYQCVCWGVGGGGGDVVMAVPKLLEILTLPPGLYQCWEGDVVMAVPKLSEILLALPFCERLWGRNVVILQAVLRLALWVGFMRVREPRTTL